jgi:alkanesulfonate monooxygenase SsuD/methylene tetrahydromethanopterin reductase-like flavin-dependent oxidoreductase (luciferase family)
VPAAFRPSADLDRSYVSVSADVIVAEDEATARELAPPTRRGSAASARARSISPPRRRRAYTWAEEDRELADRVDIRFVGSPGQVADKLEQLGDATRRRRPADHSSYQLLANEWRRR